MNSRPNRPLNFIRRHDRTLMWIYLGLVVLFVFVFAFPPVRNPLLDRIQRRVDSWDNRWTRRLENGEAMVREGRYQEAADYLADLDQHFPARSVRHARDRERERLLLALGQSYEHLGRDSAALHTYRRLVAFDPRNYRNYYALGALGQRIQDGMPGTDEILAAYTQALRIHPNHLPSARGAMLFQAAHGDTGAAGRLYQSYLDAYLLNPMTLAIGDTTVGLDVPVDGTFHEYLVPVNRRAGWSGTLELLTAGFSISLDRIALVPPLQAGGTGTRPEAELPLGSVSGTAMASAGRGTWQAQSADARISLPVTAANGIAAVRIRLRLFKPVDPTVWRLAQAAFRSDPAGLSRLTDRSLVLESEAAADSAVWRPEWAREGLMGPMTPTEGR